LLPSQSGNLDRAILDKAVSNQLSAINLKHKINQGKLLIAPSVKDLFMDRH
jgi:hypothetical protein